MRKLADLFSSDETGPVAWQNGRLIDFAEFKKAVGITANRLENCRRAALICADSYNFTVGMFALLHAGATVVLPASQHETKEKDVVDDEFIQTPGHEQLGLTPLRDMEMKLEFFTSGSTGKAKLIAKNLSMLQAEVETIEKIWGNETGHGIVFATVPHQHFYSVIFKILWPLATRRPFRADMHSLWEGLLPELENDSIIVSSPAHLQRLEKLAAKKTPSRVFCAGAKLSYAAAEITTAALHCRPTEIFGSTETGAIATRQQNEGDELWQPLPGVMISADADGNLEVSSPFSNYESIHTGDIVRIHGEKFEHLGRTDRIVKINGKRISLEQVENMLSALDVVAASSAIFLKEKDRLGAVIVLNNIGNRQLEAEGNFRFSRKLREQLTEKMEPAAIPKLWRFVEKLPTHILGKQRESDLIALFDNESS